MNIGYVDVSQAINSRGVSARISWDYGPTVTVEITGNAGYGSQAYWRIRGVNPDTSVYISDTDSQKKTFEAENGKSYAFQAVWGSRSNGAVFTVNFDSSGSPGGDDDDESTPISVVANDVYFGDPCSVTWVPSSSSAYYKLSFSIGGYYNETETIRPGTTGAYTYSGWTIPLSSANSIPDNTYGIMTVSVTQYEDSGGNTQVGIPGSATFRVTLKDSIVPLISTCAVVIDNSDNQVLDSWGVALAGYTKVNLTASASGRYGSTINSYSISGDYHVTVKMDSGETNLDYTGLPITSAGNKSFIITCTDSRGRVSSQYVTGEQIGLIEFLPYSQPKVTKFTVGKNENGNMEAAAEWSIDPIDGYNSATAVIYYKQTTSESWMSYSGSNITSGVPVELTGLTLIDKASYNFKIVVTDALGNSANKTSFISTTEVLLDFQAGGRGLGIGKICESPGMEVSMNATFYNDIFVQRDSEKYDIETYVRLLSAAVLNESKKSLLNEIYPIGSIYISTSNTDPGTLFGGVWDSLKDRFLLGAGGSYSAGSTGGESTHVLTEDEMPEHSHWGAARPSYSVKPGTHPSAVMDDVKINYLKTDSVGSGKAHNNMPPYLTVYMWKRTA